MDSRILSTSFWEWWQFFLVDFLSRGETINSKAYIEIPTRLKATIWRVRLNLPIDNVLLLYDSAWPHTNIRTREITALGVDNFTVSSILFRFSAFWLSSLRLHERQDDLRGKHYASYEKAKYAVIKWFLELSTEFYKADTCSRSKVEHCYYEKRWLYWKVGMWSLEEQVHFDVWYMYLCR